jgi:hypothetical protein
MTVSKANYPKVSRGLCVLLQPSSVSPQHEVKSLKSEAKAISRQKLRRYQGCHHLCKLHRPFDVADPLLTFPNLMVAESMKNHGGWIDKAYADTSQVTSDVIKNCFF